MKKLYPTLIRSGVVLLLIGTTNFGVAVFTAEKLRAGVTETQLRAMVDAYGYILKAGEGADPWWVYRKSNNEIIATYHFCKGRVYQQSLTLTGGLAAYIKRVAQFNRQFGEGKVSVETSMESLGERNLLEFVWRAQDELIALTYFSSSPSVNENQWHSTTVSSVCDK